MRARITRQSRQDNALIKKNPGHNRQLRSKQGFGLLKYQGKSKRISFWAKYKKKHISHQNPNRSLF